MKKGVILSVFLKFRTVIIAILLAGSFFAYYNIFLIDRTLENLKFSLEQTALAYDIDGVDGLDMLITKAIAGEIPPYGIGSVNTMNLEYARDITKTGRHFRQLGYMRVALDTVIKEKEKERGLLLTFLDRLNRPIRQSFAQLTYFYRLIFGPKKAEMPPAEIDIALTEKFKTLEEEKNFRKLIANYKNFIVAYPEYEKISLAKLRLAYTYQRLGEYDVAMELYGEIARMYSAEREGRIAEIFLSGLKAKGELLKRANLLIIESNRLSPGEREKKQELLYEIGLIYAELFDLEDAAKFFKRAVEIEPSSDTALKAQYGMAWLHKEENKLDKSLKEFSEIAVKEAGDLVFNSRYQQANIHHLKGEHEKFIELSLKLADDYQHKPAIASLCLFQVGASYMYDLNDTEKAQEIFQRLIKTYPDTSYAKYLVPVSPIGLFVTYLVPRATRVVAWRTLGLLCLSGYTGEILKFEIISNEAGFNMGFNNWLKSELPDTVGNLYVDIRGHKTDFERNKAISQGRITMGQFNVRAKGEWRLGITEGKGLDLIVKKAFLEKIPIPPVLINNSLVGIKRIAEKNFPIQITRVSIGKDKARIEGIGNKAILGRLKKDMKIIFMADLEMEDIKDPGERQRAYALFNEKFPEGDFSPVRKQDEESLFLDFFTRISLYLSFKLLETVKDAKLDFERSVRTLGRLMMKKERFRIDFKESRINANIARFIRYEFPWLIDESFLLDMPSLKVDFRNNGDINFKGQANLGYGSLTEALKPNKIDIEGTMVFEIDEESGIPRWLFKEVNVNNKPFPLRKLNAMTLRCLDILKDENIPLTVEEIRPYENGIIFKGEGAADFTSRVFADPHPFVIFQIRKFDLPMAGVQRIRRDIRDGEAQYYRGKMPDDWTPGKTP